jgi:cystathionine beta-lyase
MSFRKDLHEPTRLIHDRLNSRPLERTVGPPIQRGSTVLLDKASDLYDHGQVTYGRGGLAVHRALAEALCELESGFGCQLYPSGLSAVTGALISVLKCGDELLVSDNVYGPVRRFCDQVLTRLGMTVRYFPPRETAAAVLAMGGEQLRAVLMETPGSLTFEICDVPGICALAAERGVLTLVDNTWGAGLLFKPLEHGADISIQALTKYVCGHSDVFLGSACASDPAIVSLLEEAMWNFGWSVSPDDAYQALRGLRTLPLRLERHGENALEVARWLDAQPRVASVLHPALPRSPDHAIWRRDYTGACGLFGVVLKPASARAVDAFLDALSLFGLGFSWGGFESLATSCDSQLRQRHYQARLEGPLLRIHVGLEDPADLIADLKRGFEALASATRP